MEQRLETLALEYHLLLMAQEIAEPEGFCFPAILRIPIPESDLRTGQLDTEVSGH